MNDVAFPIGSALKAANLFILYVKKEHTVWPMLARQLTVGCRLNMFQVLKDNIIFEAAIRLAKVLKENIHILQDQLVHRTRYH